MKARGKPRSISIKPVFTQMIKFSIVGVINTVLDFSILNVLVLMTGIVSGSEIFLLNGISWACASINSYFMNKRWSFNDSSKDLDSRKMFKFFLVVSTGFLLNGSILIYLTTFFYRPEMTSPQLWVNISKSIATVVSMIWIFICNKAFVFNAD